MKSGILVAAVFLLICTITLSCASGGKIVSSENQYNIVVSYEPKGTFPENARWFLVKTDSGYKILEKVENSGDVLIDQCFKDRKGRHFVIWSEFLGEHSTAFEFVIPNDFTKTALRYAYPAGSYAVVESNGVKRPVPHKRKNKPVTRLVPVVRK